jgi:hypothetical protein
MSLWSFNPPTEDTVSNVAYDVPPLWNRLMGYFSPRKRGRAIWVLEDGTLSFDQPYPTIEDTPANKVSLFPAVPDPPSGLGTSTSNLIALTYQRVFLGGHQYLLDSTIPGDALLITEIAVFLNANGYTASDWLVEL